MIKVKFWGTRGSIPTPGKSTVKYGGNTPCVEVRLQEKKLLIFDAGTGIRDLGDVLASSNDGVKACIAITHPHWDHIQGLPFFKPLFESGNEFTIIGPKPRRQSLKRIISEQMNRVYFPVPFDELKSTITFRAMREESIPIFNAKLTSMYVNHPHLTIGYRLDSGKSSIVYISDNEPFDLEIARSVRNVDRSVIGKYARNGEDPDKRIVDFARGASIFIHDATYTPDEYVHHVGWGHSHYLFALELAARAAVKKLVLFHHDQTHTDERIDAIVQKCCQLIRVRGYRFSCVAAREGMEHAC